jgi:hypothetical protein
MYVYMLCVRSGILNALTNVRTATSSFSPTYLVVTSDELAAVVNARRDVEVAIKPSLRAAAARRIIYIYVCMH